MFGLATSNVHKVTEWIVSALIPAFVAPNVLKWHWWRFNGYGFFAGMVAGTEYLMKNQAGVGSRNLYYWYYATRLNYLRGGFAWEAWRTTMAAQLISIQREDGTFHTYASEGPFAEAYSTALGSMILRMCLNDVPAYLKQEVRGF